jgi:hypothetical protein
LVALLLQRGADIFTHQPAAEYSMDSSGRNKEKRTLFPEIGTGGNTRNKRHSRKIDGLPGG